MSTIDQARELFDIQGSDQQIRIIEEALEGCDFPWEWLKPGLRAAVGRERIPVEWADLSRYREAREAGEDHHPHHESEDVFHVHAHEGEDSAHGLGFRDRVLGLAWYSGKVSVDVSLTNDPELAKEVFLSEGAHMIDFFFMEDSHRVGVWNAVHGDEHDLLEDTNVEDGTDLGHGHSWFDVGGYYSWVGEAFMGLFVKAFSDSQVTIGFDHPTTPEAAAETRAALLGQALPPPPEEEHFYFALERSGVFHDSHKTIDADVTFATFDEAEASGRRPCRVCVPEPLELDTAGIPEEPEDADHLEDEDARSNGLDELQEHLLLVAQGVIDVPGEPIEESPRAFQDWWFVPRSAWGARAPRSRTHETWMKGTALHWNGPKLGSFNHDRCPHIVRAIQSYHMDTRKWADGAYSGIACPHGYVFELRGPNVRTAANGTSAGNDYYYAIMLLVGEGDPLTDDGKLAYHRGWTWLEQEGEARGEVTTHQSIRSTACPGPPVITWHRNGLPLPTKQPKEERLFDMLIYVHPREGTPDAIAGLHKVVGSQQAALSSNLDDVRRQTRTGGKVVAAGGPAVEKLAEEIGGKWSELHGRGPGRHQKDNLVILWGNTWQESADMLLDEQP